MREHRHQTVLVAGVVPVNAAGGNSARDKLPSGIERSDIVSQRRDGLRLEPPRLYNALATEQLVKARV